MNSNISLPQAPEMMEVDVKPKEESGVESQAWYSFEQLIHEVPTLLTANNCRMVLMCPPKRLGS